MKQWYSNGREAIRIDRLFRWSIREDMTRLIVHFERHAPYLRTRVTIAPYFVTDKTSSCYYAYSVAQIWCSVRIFNIRLIVRRCNEEAKNSERTIYKILVSLFIRRYQYPFFKQTFEILLLSRSGYNKYRHVFLIFKRFFLLYQLPYILFIIPPDSTNSDSNEISIVFSIVTW